MSKYYHIRFGEKIGYFEYDPAKNILFLMGRDFNKNIARIAPYSFPSNDTFKYGMAKNFRIGMIWFEVLGEVNELPIDFLPVDDDSHSYWKIKIDGNIEFFEVEETKYDGRIIWRKLINISKNSDSSVCRGREYVIPAKVQIKAGEKFNSDLHQFEFIEIVNKLP